MWQVFLNLQRNRDESVARQVVEVIYQTRERVFHQDIQTPRSGLKKRGAAEFF